jgi:hypothetical protein
MGFYHFGNCRVRGCEPQDAYMLVKVTFTRHEEKLRPYLAHLVNNNLFYFYNIIIQLISSTALWFMRQRSLQSQCMETNILNTHEHHFGYRPFTLLSFQNNFLEYGPVTFRCKWRRFLPILRPVRKRKYCSLDQRTNFGTLLPSTLDDGNRSSFRNSAFKNAQEYG